MIAFFPKFKDRRVDKTIQLHGYVTAESELFYSPILLSFFFLPVFALLLFPITVALVSNYPIYCAIYLIISYLQAAYLNNSFVISGKKLLVVNNNSPFRRCVAYDLKQVKIIKIDRSRFLRITWFFAQFGYNYVEVITENQVARYYCVGLEQDAYDENFTEKTMDDFHAALKQNNVATAFNLDQ